MGPVLPPVDRYAHRREAQRNAAQMAKEFSQRIQEKQAIALEDEALEKEGIVTKGLRGKAREEKIKAGYQQKLKSGEEERLGKQEEGEISSFVSKGKEKREKEFDYSDPSTWTDKEIDRFRAFEGKTPKSKMLSNLAKNEYEKRSEYAKQTTKDLEKQSPLQGALGTIEKMKSLRKKGNLGIGVGPRGFFSQETRKDAGEYEQLGKSLISFASTIPIRNQAEFETLSHSLFDPSISDAKAEGILSAMELIIKNSLSQSQEMVQPQQMMNQPQQQQERPPLTSFFR